MTPRSVIWPMVKFFTAVFAAACLYDLVVRAVGGLG